MKNKVLSALLNDPERHAILTLARELNLPQWCLSAGFVRNVVWDVCHGYDVLSPLNDVDLVYFDPDCSKEQDRLIEAELKRRLDVNWSVKNQARMHERNQDSPYKNTLDAMSYWPEVQTAVGIRWGDGGYKFGGYEFGGYELVSPFPLDKVLTCRVTLNPKRPKHAVFNQRLNSKGWLSQWPKLEVDR